MEKSKYFFLILIVLATCSCTEKKNNIEKSNDVNLDSVETVIYQILNISDRNKIAVIKSPEMGKKHHLIQYYTLINNDKNACMQIIYNKNSLFRYNYICYIAEADAKSLFLLNNETEYNEMTLMDYFNIKSKGHSFKIHKYNITTPKRSGIKIYYLDNIGLVAIELKHQIIVFINNSRAPKIDSYANLYKEVIKHILHENRGNI